MAIITTIMDLMPLVKVLTSKGCIQISTFTSSLQLKSKLTVSSTLISVTCITITIIITKKLKRSKQKKIWSFQVQVSYNSIHLGLHLPKVTYTHPTAPLELVTTSTSTQVWIKWVRCTEVAWTTMWISLQMQTSSTLRTTLTAWCRQCNLDRPTQVRARRTWWLCTNKCTSTTCNSPKCRSGPRCSTQSWQRKLLWHLTSSTRSHLNWHSNPRSSQ